MSEALVRNLSDQEIDDLYDLINDGFEKLDTRQKTFLDALLNLIMMSSAGHQPIYFRAVNSSSFRLNQNKITYH